jgi:hypothetical protein
MASKPRKQFDGIGRPQGFIDDAAKAAVNAVRKVAGRPYYMYLKDETTGKAAKEFGRIKVSGGKTIKKPPMPKQLPSIKGKNPRPKPDMGNPKAPTTADVDRILSKAKAERAAVEAKKFAQKRMSPYYKTSKNSRNYRG